MGMLIIDGSHHLTALNEDSGRHVAMVNWEGDKARHDADCRLLAGAWNSYVLAYGQGAAADAAEDDLLNVALSACRKLLDAERVADEQGVEFALELLAEASDLARAAVPSDEKEGEK